MFGVIKPIRFMMAFETGGGSTSRRILRANVAEIEKLRRSPLSGPRPTEIRSIALVDDESAIVRILQRLIGRKLDQMDIAHKKLSPDDLVRLDPEKLSHFILTLDSAEDIKSMPELITSFKIDLTLTDHDMYGFNGSELIRQARELGHQGFMIGMSGMEKNLDLFYQAGADLAIDKPFENSTILNLITS